LAPAIGLALLFAITGMSSARGAEPVPAVSTKVTSGNVIVVRPDRVDITVGGEIVASARYTAGPLSIQGLSQIVNRPTWLSVSGRTVVLRAGLYQAPQSSLVVTAPAVRSLRLVGDASGVNGTMRGSSAALAIRGVSVTGWDELGGEPAAQSPMRPYLYYVHGSSVSLVSATFDHLGRPASGGSGVSLGSDTTATVAGSVFSNSSTGLSVTGAGAVSISRSSFRNNAGDGLAVKASSPIQLSHLSSSSNGGFGVHVRLTRAARLLAVTTSRNADGGISVDASQQITVIDALSTNEHTGLVVSRKSDQVTVMTSRATGDDIGLQVQPGSSRVTLYGVSATTSHLAGLDLAGNHVRVQGASVSGAPDGIALNHQASNVVITNSTIRSVSIGVEVRAAATHVVLEHLEISQAHGAGILANSNAIAMSHLQIFDAGVGVRVNGAVASATLATSTITRASVGLDLAARVDRFTVSAVTIKQASTAITSSSPHLQISDGAIVKASIGMRLCGATIAHETILGVQEGVRATSGAVVHMDGVRIAASAVGFRVAPGGHIDLQNGSVSAKTLSIGHVRYIGHNVLPAESLRGYGLAAIAAAVCACLLELMRRIRERAEDRTWLLPSGVLNIR
jgi:hypothetical protein